MLIVLVPLTMVGLSFAGWRAWSTFNERTTIPDRPSEQTYTQPQPEPKAGSLPAGNLEQILKDPAAYVKVAEDQPTNRMPLDLRVVAPARIETNFIRQYADEQVHVVMVSLPSEQSQPWLDELAAQIAGKGYRSLVQPGPGGRSRQWVYIPSGTGQTVLTGQKLIVNAMEKQGEVQVQLRYHQPR